MNTNSVLNVKMMRMLDMNLILKVIVYYKSVKRVHNKWKKTNVLIDQIVLQA